VKYFKSKELKCPQGQMSKLKMARWPFNFKKVNFKTLVDFTNIIEPSSTNNIANNRN
jgi:hypothetical protein